MLSDQTQLVSARAQAPLPRPASGREGPPLCQCGGASVLVGLAVDEVAFLTEVVVEGGVEALSGQMYLRSRLTPRPPRKTVSGPPGRAAVPCSAETERLLLPPIGRRAGAEADPEHLR